MQTDGRKEARQVLLLLIAVLRQQGCILRGHLKGAIGFIKHKIALLGFKDYFAIALCGYIVACHQIGVTVPRSKKMESLKSDALS